MHVRNQRIVPVLAAALVVVAAAVAGAGAARAQDATPFDPASFTIGLEPVASGLAQPVYVTAPDDDSGRLFVVEREGRIRIIVAGQVLERPFLDIVPMVESGGSEQGLLSVAFPPDYRTSGEFYVYYTAGGGNEGANTIARFRVSEADPDLADAQSGEVLLAVADSRRNHNGGLVLFGPDGFLYAGLGDGGGGGDPGGNGQNPTTLLGAILRLDVSDGTERPYAIPTGNPFADGGSGAPEIWAWGLRNPWRFSFDRANGDLYIGDVGQGAIEEIDWLPAGAQAGANFGWNVMEGANCFAADACDPSGFTLPVFAYSHDFGCSVTGGYVYRGERFPALEGVYLFADFCTGFIWGLGRDAAGDWVASAPIESGLSVSSFGEDVAGELYLVSLGGEIFRITDGGAGS